MANLSPIIDDNGTIKATFTECLLCIRRCVRAYYILPLNMKSIPTITEKETDV
jgi:hypothetical protein